MEDYEVLIIFYYFTRFIECGGEINEINIDKKSILTSKLFVDEVNFAINCTWTVKAPPNKNVMLRWDGYNGYCEL